MIKTGTECLGERKETHSKSKDVDKEGKQCICVALHERIGGSA